MINQSGFKGKYGTSDYIIEKIAKLTSSQFLNNPKEQEIAMNKAIFIYYGFLKQENLLRYLGQEIGGMKITLEMLFAGCHFSPTYLQLFLMSNGKTNSKYGNISISYYMKLFKR